MRFLVTGATGLLGGELCRVFKAHHEVIGWARGVTARAGDPSVQLESVDLTDEAAVLDGFGRVKPDLVVHAAAMADVDACETDPKGAFAINVGGTQAVSLGCSNVGALLIAVSTDYVFDGKISRPHREEDPPHPLSTYARSKLEGERTALRVSPRCLVVRVSGLFGSGRTNFVSQAAQRLREGQTVPVVTNQVNSPSYTADVAEGIQQLAEQVQKDPQEAGPRGRFHGVVHLANAGGATRLSVAQAIAAALGAPDSLIERTTWVALHRPARRPANSRLDCARFAGLTGTSLRPWEAALKAYLETLALDPKPLP